MDPTQIGQPTPPRQVDPNSPYLRDFNQRDLSELTRLYQNGRVGQRDLALASKLTRVATQNPSLHTHLEPLLREAAVNWRAELDAFRLASTVYPVITHSRWASLTNPEKHTLMRKLAHQPHLKGMGLNKEAVRDGRAFMVYKIDLAANNSKFYEGVITEEDGGYRVLRRWGALTDSTATPPIKGGTEDTSPAMIFPTMALAQAELSRHLKKRLAHGYVDAFGTKHKTPDGKALPMGQYPVGLTRNVGFGWGTQSITHCIPGLKQLEDALAQARSEIQQTGRSDAVKTHLEEAQTLLKTVAHADSTMAQKILAQIKKPLSRVMGSPRLLGKDPDGVALAKELRTIQVYVHKQLSLCTGA